MKSSLLIFLLFTAFITQAQVAINTTGAVADVNAMLDVQSTSKGLKFPRMTTAQRKAIAVTTADAGLFVYDTDKQSLYMHDGNEWRPLAAVSTKYNTVLTNITSAQTSQNTLGNTVAIDGSYAVATSPRDTVYGVPDQGSATVFKLVSGTWTEQAKLLATDSYPYQRIGNAVAISNDFVAVGAEETKVGTNQNQGAVYIFKRTGETWSQTAKLLAADGSNASHFGHRVIMQGNLLIISAYGDQIGANPYQGSVYVYAYTGNAWVQTQKITATDGAVQDVFGSSISLQDNWLAIGAPYDDVGGVQNAGSVHLYYKTTATTFGKNQQISSPNLVANEYFGFAVAIKQDTVAVSRMTGLPNEHVTIFRKLPNTNTWTRTDGIYAPSYDYETYTPFGNEIFWRGGTLAVSSPTVRINENSGQGAVYFYNYRPSQSYQLSKKITDPDGFTYSKLGTSIAYYGNRFIFGSFRDGVFFGTFDD